MALAVIVEHVSEERLRVVVWNGQRALASLELRELPTRVSRFDVQLALSRGRRSEKLVRDFATNGVDYGTHPRRPHELD